MTDVASHSRFDNLSVPELLIRAEELRVEEGTIQQAIQAKLLADCPIKKDKVYRIMGAGYHRSYLRGRRFFVMGVSFHTAKRSTWEYWLTAWGVVERPRPDKNKIGSFDGRYNYKSNTFNVSSLDPTTEEDPPQ